MQSEEKTNEYNNKMQQRLFVQLDAGNVSDIGNNKNNY